MDQTWSALSERMRKAVEKRGFGSPTRVQLEGMPQILSGSDVLLMAPTGCGKTESVLLPVFDIWLRHEHKPISILYITPLKSLNRDLQKRVAWWAKELDLDASVRHGDTTQYERGMQSANPPDMLIVTPEALQSLLVGKNMREHLSNVRWIIIDEVHEIVASKRGVQLSVALERLKELITSAERKIPQIIGLSATIGSPAGVAAYITGGKECSIVDTMHIRGLKLSVEAPQPGEDDYKTAPQMFMTPQTAARVRRMAELMATRESVLTFTNTRESAEVVSSRLKAFDSRLGAETHHSSLSKDIRVKAEEGFKSGSVKALICTSSLELGIDIGSIDFIIQFMSPRQVSKLLQRLGRSGHTSTGISDGVIVSSDADDCFESAAIARLAIDGKIEPGRLYGQSLDVLMHQIAGLSLEEYCMPAGKAYSIIRRAWPFRQLTAADFASACSMLERLGLVWLRPAESSSSAKDAGLGFGIVRRKKTWEYYFRSMSTIPDSRNYKVLDVVSNQFIGTLDAEFAALHGEPGTGFIVKGQAWRILEVLRDRIMVEPMSGIEAAIPAWVGELIPVPARVAMLAARMRKEMWLMLGEGKMKEEIRERFMAEYPLSSDAFGVMHSAMKKQADDEPADERNMIIEHMPVDGISTVVIGSCFGSLINDTIGRAVADTLAARLGTIGLQADSQRIVLRMQAGGVDDVLHAMRSLKPGQLKPVLDACLPNTELFQWRFVHVAQRAGAISRDADFGKACLRRVIESYRGTPVFAETLHELYAEKLDLRGAEEILGMMHDGKIKVSVRSGLSFMARLGVMPRHEMMAAGKPDSEIFRIFKERLMKTKVRLLCTQCGSAVNYVVEKLPDEIRCVGCRARMVGVIHPDDMDSELLVNRHIKGGGVREGEREALEKIMDCAAIVAGSGRDAVIALAGRGVGPRAAGRILRRPGRGDEFLKDILREEQLYARNKRFWR